MMEVIKSNDGKVYFIEINPRFWGPLQLALDCCPEVLELFAKDCDFDVKEVPMINKKNTGMHGLKAQKIVIVESIQN